MNELALFAGAGGGILGGHLLGWRTVCAVEWEPYPASVLVARQNDGLLPPFPIWDDVQTFDGRPWRGIVDVVSGGFPCQDISKANQNGDGLDGERSGMWKEMARIISEVRPQFVFVENSPMLTSGGLGVVLGDLAQMGFDAEWGVLGADNVGAYHRRERIWVVANARSFRLDDGPNKRNSLQKQTVCQDKSNNRHRVWSKADKCISFDDWKSFASEFFGMDDGVASRLDRLKAIGNGQVSAVAAVAFQTLLSRLQEGRLMDGR
ncbi:MAG: DNA cytosine methyltransferase [Planctomycetes bacterium]|nr:DNA cytosine methyltransferase [Planctomycetota bacterium]